VTLLEAMQYARDPGVRRASWVLGLSLRWRDSMSCWVLSNEFQRLLGQSKDVSMLDPQGLLTPTSICADDWGPVSEENQ
jgi:hypothetical protein